VLSEEEKRELREMAASEKLREEFRTLRRNSRTMEGRISVDELAHWLTVMNRICPGDSKRRKFIHDAGMRL
jgi:Ca2+-binding EF-hand superfamily protein